jgi:hypothetical protein
VDRSCWGLHVPFIERSENVQNATSFSFNTIAIWQTQQLSFEQQNLAEAVTLFKTRKFIKFFLDREATIVYQHFIITCPLQEGTWQTIWPTQKLI